MPGLGTRYNNSKSGQPYYEVRRYTWATYNTRAARGSEYNVLAVEETPHQAYLSAFEAIQKGIDSEYYDQTLDIVKVVPYDAAVYKVSIDTIKDLHKQHSEEAEPTIEIETPNGL